MFVSSHGYENYWELSVLISACSDGRKRVVLLQPMQAIKGDCSGYYLVPWVIAGLPLPWGYK